MDDYLAVRELDDGLPLPYLVLMPLTLGRLRIARADEWSLGEHY